MRTTVTIDDALLAEAKIMAARDNRRLGDVIDDALRRLLAERGSAERPERWVLPTSGRGGLRPGIDLLDKEGLAETLGQNDYPFR